MADGLLTEIRDFLKKTGMGPSYFGKLSTGNSELVARLEDGKTVTLPTAERVRVFMKGHKSGLLPRINKPVTNHGRHDATVETLES